MAKQIHNISILGDGGWGTTLAIHLFRKGYAVKLWGVFPNYVYQLNKTRQNSRFLPGIRIPRNIVILSELSVALAGADLIVLAIPSQYFVSILRKLKKFDLSQSLLLSVIKGIDTSTLQRMSEIIHKELGDIKLAVLSGPTIAGEIARGIPSTAVIASKDMRIAKKLQAVITSETFRIYTNPDLAGVELGGSIKNVIAIACGVCDGLGFGTNAKAAILSRGLAEMARLGTAMGAKTKTFFGLSGLGDLATTCFNPQSRNRSVGEKIGRGNRIGTITKNMAMVAEGVTTVKAVYALSRKHNVSMPITTEVYNIIYKNKNPLVAVKDLMRRQTKPE